jgi:hypothetical protein
MNHDLDSLLQRLRDAGATHPRLADVERRMWQQINAAESRAVVLPRLRLSFQVVAVAAAFAWGVLRGVDVTGPAPPSQAFLAEEMELPPPDAGAFFL